MLKVGTKVYNLCVVLKPLSSTCLLIMLHNPKASARTVSIIVVNMKQCALKQHLNMPKKITLTKQNL